jgi:H+/Cl- antiporter ClcA
VAANQVPQWLKRYSRRSLIKTNKGLATLLVYVFASLVGLVAVGFAIAADYAAEWNLELFEQHKWIALALPPFIFPLSVWLSNVLFWGAAGGGIPQAIKIIRHPKPRFTERLLGIRAFIGKLLLTPLVLASGAAMGREGPTVQLGACIMAFSSKIKGVQPIFDSRSLIIAGGAAGIAAAFNTPLGGLMFAFEELGNKRMMRHTSTLLMAIVVAGWVALIIQGNYSYFGYSNATIDWGEHWITIVVLAICTGMVGGAYGRSMLMVVSPNNPIGGFRAKHPYWFAAICGILLSCMAYALGSSVLGAGYQETKMALQNEESMSPSYWLTKMTATVVSFASGAPGGVFSPTLSIGAGFGHFFAGLTSLETEPIMLLAMVGVLAAVSHCPITAVVIVVEMVDNRELLMPLILVSALASQVSKQILPTSIYHLLANQIRVKLTTSEPKTDPNTPDLAAHSAPLPTPPQNEDSTYRKH